MRYSFFLKSSQFIIDILILAVSLILSYIIRFDGIPEEQSYKQMIFILPWLVLIRITSNFVFGLYNLVWRYISLNDTITFLKSFSLVTFFFLALRLALSDNYAYVKLPVSVIIIEFILSYGSTISVRVLRRLIFEKTESRKLSSKPKRNTLLVGAGRSGVMIAKEIPNRPDIGMNLIGFIDDDKLKLNSTIQGSKVLGSTTDLPHLIQEYQISLIIITIANAPAQLVRDVMRIGEQFQVTVQIMPALIELLDNKVSVSKIRNVKIEDLLGRTEVQIENDSHILASYQGKRILVTGGGGSIGSELCRQLCRTQPSELVILEKDENNLFYIEMELQLKYSEIPIHPIIIDIRDVNAVRRIFERFQPQIVFHAAAYKHVPLLELNPHQAIQNIVGATKKLATIAEEVQVETFVMISTDKAVNPSSVMGASKRIAEIFIQLKASHSNKTKFSCVRFGNVLGSRGSVIPTFKKQIKAGGPVTVTHPEIIRYFMTIPEACKLVMQAGSFGKGGEIFILDMGQPVKIVDLAKDLIKLSGFSIEEIGIKFTGLRPGEKLYEELYYDDKKVQKTTYQKIFIEQPIQRDEGDEENFLSLISQIEQVAVEGNQEELRNCLRKFDIGFRG